MPVRYNLSSVWARLSIFSQWSIIQYLGLCVFSLPISFVMIERICILCLIIIIKSEVGTITHCFGLGHETMVCAVCLSIFLLVQLFSLTNVERSITDTNMDRCLRPPPTSVCLTLGMHAVSVLPITKWKFAGNISNAATAIWQRRWSESWWTS